MTNCLFPLEKIVLVTIAITTPSPRENYYCYRRGQPGFFLSQVDRRQTRLESIKGSPRQAGSSCLFYQRRASREPWLNAGRGPRGMEEGVLAVCWAVRVLGVRSLQKRLVTCPVHCTVKVQLSFPGL